MRRLLPTLVQRVEDLSDLLPCLFRLFRGLEAVAEVPRRTIKIRVIPGKACNPAVPQNEKVVFTCAWLPALGLRRGHRFS